ncbi:hypothetical protein JD844_000722, partial [Phrynosoma platyrhinos]
MCWASPSARTSSWPPGRPSPRLRKPPSLSPVSRNGCCGNWGPTPIPSASYYALWFGLLCVCGGGLLALYSHSPHLHCVPPPTPQIPQNLPCSVTLQPGPEDTGKVCLFLGFG